MDVLIYSCREAQVMSWLWEQGSSTLREALEGAFKPDIPYSTALSLFQRLV